MGILLALWLATATFVWEAPREGPRPQQYLVYQQVSGRAWQLVAVVDAPETSWQDPATAQGRLCLQVFAQEATQVSPGSNVVCVRCNPQRCRAE